VKKVLTHSCLASAPSNDGSSGPQDVGQIGVVTGRDELSRSSFLPFDKSTSIRKLIVFPLHVWEHEILSKKEFDVVKISR